MGFLFLFCFILHGIIMESWNNLIRFIVKHCDDEDFDKDTLHALIQENPIVISNTESGNSVLHFAAIGNSSALLEYILPFCPDFLVNYSNNQSESPLHWACQSGNLDNFLLLISYGADVIVLMKMVVLFYIGLSMLVL